MIKIHPIKAFSDNYIWCIQKNSYAIVVDPGDADPVELYLERNQLTLKAILITHHHYDHIDGVAALVKNWNCPVYAPVDDRIPFEYHAVKENDQLNFNDLGLKLNVLDTPGHTLSHIVYHNDEILFCGDTLFSLGCGRMFEGSAEQFHHSLNKIKDLGDNMQVYCTHEYTSSNLDFALYLEPENIQLQQFKNQLSVIKNNNQPSLPSILKIEKNLNPFLRCNNSQIRKALAKITGKKPISSVDCFAQLRALKDSF